MASEYLVLTEIASKLSTYVQNRVSSNESLSAQTQKDTGRPRKISRPASLRRRQGTINDDAKLLMNLKDVVIHQGSVKEETQEKEENTEYATTISPSLSFEARRHYEAKTSNAKGLIHSHREMSNKSRNVTFIHPEKLDSQQCDSECTFSLSSPSLSLKGSTATATTPAQLFSRPISKRSSLDVTDVAETLASNVMQSFITSLEWRTKVWVKDLSRLATLKFNHEVAKLEKNGSLMSAAKNQGKKSQKKNSTSIKKTGLAALKDKFKKSQEARVIKALSQTSSCIHVHDVRTTFFILEQQLNTAPTEKEEEEKDDSHMSGPSLVQTQAFRPLKKRRTVTDDEMSSTEGRSPSPSPKKYTLTHALNMDSRCSVSTSSEDKISVSLQTPGVIHGTFVRNEDGEVMLVDLSISLDTQCLALSMEQKSRLVVRTAAEECIISPPCTKKYAVQQSGRVSENRVSTGTMVSNNGGLYPHHFHPYSKPHPLGKRNYPSTPQTSYVTPINGHGDKALITPTERDHASSDSDGMPPPPPRLPLDGKNSTLEMRTSFLNPRRVSPTNAAESDIDLSSPTPAQVTILSAPSTTKDLELPLVSPHLTSNVMEETNKEKSLDLNGPLLPALVEVACAVHTLCH
jgi:hypothetical protein